MSDNTCIIDLNGEPAPKLAGLSPEVVTRPCLSECGGGQGPADERDLHLQNRGVEKTGGWRSGWMIETERGVFEGRVKNEEKQDGAFVQRRAPF